MRRSRGGAPSLARARVRPARARPPDVDKGVQIDVDRKLMTLGATQQRKPAGHAGGELRSKLANVVLELLERQILQLPIA